MLAFPSGTDSLYVVHILDQAVLGMREELQTDLEQKLLYGQHTNADEIYADIKEMIKSLAGTKESFYYPLTVNMNHHEYGDYYEASNQTLIDNSEAIVREQAAEVNMAEYVDEQAGTEDKLVFVE